MNIDPPIGRPTNTQSTGFGVHDSNHCSGGEQDRMMVWSGGLATGEPHVMTWKSHVTHAVTCHVDKQR